MKDVGWRRRFVEDDVGVRGVCHRIVRVSCGAYPGQKYAMFDDRRRGPVVCPECGKKLVVVSYE